MWRFGLLLLFITASKQLSISEFTVQSPVREGEDALLQCRYQLDKDETDKALFVKWWYTPSNGSSEDRSQLYQRIVGHEPVTIHHDIKIVENDDILLLNVTVKDSGTYECEVSNIDEVRVSRDLIVFTTGNGVSLEMTAVEDGPDEDNDEDVLIFCQATGVAPYPDLTIFIDGEMINSTDSVISDGDLFEVYSNITVNDDIVNGAEVKCQLSFTDVEVTDDSLTVTEVYSGNVEFTTENTTEIVSTEANEIVLPNSATEVSTSVAVFLLAMLFIF